MGLARLAFAPLVLALVACGGGDPPVAECGDVPDARATRVNADVAFAAPSGVALEADRVSGSELPWFTKFGLLVRGEGDVVVRAPDGVKISGWRGTSDTSLQSAVLVTADSRCWTAYPGGLAFSGRRCARLAVEGPGDQRGTALFGLRRDCVP
jgi:hypothetical protein